MIECEQALPLWLCFLHDQYGWFPQLLLSVIILGVLARFFELQKAENISLLLREFRELFALNWTLGAINAAGICVLFVAGLVAAVLLGGTKLLQLAGIVAAAPWELLGFLVLWLLALSIFSGLSINAVRRSES